MQQLSPRARRSQWTSTSPKRSRSSRAQPAKKPRPQPRHPNSAAANCPQEEIDKLKKMGMIWLAFKDELAFDDRPIVQEYEILGAYHERAVLMQDHDMPEMLSHGMSSRSHGPFQIYMDYELCKAFAAEYDFVTVEVAAPKPPHDRKSYVLSVSAKRVFPEKTAYIGVQTMLNVGPALKPHLDREGGWADVSLKPGIEHLAIHTEDIKRAFQRLSVRVYSTRRPQVKIPKEGAEEDERKEWLSLGAGARLSHVNLTIKPIDPSVKFEDFKWPPVLTVHSAMTGQVFELRYRL